MEQSLLIDEVNKGKLLSNFLKITAVFAVLYVGVSYVIEFFYGMAFMSSVFALLVVAFFLYKKEILSYKKTSNFYVATCCFVAILGCSYFSGGVFSPVAMWFVLIPVIALLLLGSTKSTFFWLACVLIIVSIYAILVYLGRDFPIEYNAKNYDKFFQIMCWAGLIVIVFLVSSVFETNQRKALDTVKIQNVDLKEYQDEITANNEELHQQKEELSTILDVVQDKNKVIEKQNEDVRSSIVYASRIQNALLPHNARLDNYFKDDYFIFNKPRDIVSGDFYWCEKLEDYTILVVADCTGHGVPGAFMSMLGATSLNSVVFQEGVFRADKILNLLHNYIYKSLQQERGGSSDGMDVSVLVIYDSIPIAEYAGAMNPLYYIQDGEFNQIKGDPKPIGSDYYGKDREYTKHIIDISKPTTFYMASDGFQDQFGGKENRKYMKKRFKNLLHTISDKSMEEQKRTLSSELREWIGAGTDNQIDDILVIGTKINDKQG